MEAAGAARLAKTTSVWLSRPSASSVPISSPKRPSRYVTTAAWSRSTSGQVPFPAYRPSDGTGAPCSGAPGAWPQPPACGTVYATYRKKGAAPPARPRSQPSA